jgi:Flp pilus assembly protein TadD
MPTDVASLQKRLQEVEIELEVTKENLKNSRIEVDTYRTQLDSVNLQLQALKNKQSVDDKMGRLLAENKALTDKLTTAQKQIDALKSPNSKSKVALMETQLKNLQDQFDESQASNKAYQSTITTLQQHLDQAQAELVADNQKLAAAGPSSPEYETIKRENEVMRGILTREIQEQAHRDMAKRLYQEEFDNLKIKSKVLQEQLDILASPMTPATTDEERALLASLKTPDPSLSTPPPPDGSGNTLSVASTQTGTTSPTSTTPTTPDPSATGTTTPAAPTTTTTDTTTTSTTPPTNPAPDTTGTTTTPPPATPMPDTVITPTPTTPPATTPTPTDTSTQATTTPPTTPTMPATTPTTPPQAPTETALPPTTTTYSDTTVKQSANAPATPDPTQYSTKARLPDEMRDTAQQAADLFKNKRYDEAAAKYQTIIDKYPESLYAWSNLGVVRYQQGDLDDALKALQQAVKLSPTDSFSYANLGIVYYEMKQYENAIDALNAAKALDPNDAKVRNYLGCACSQKGWTEAAEKEFLKAIELDPDFGDAHFNLALVYATEKPPLTEMARKEYKKAQELGIGKDDRLEKLLGQPAAAQ